MATQVTAVLVLAVFVAIVGWIVLRYACGAMWGIENASQREDDKLHPARGAAGRRIWNKRWHGYSQRCTHQQLRI